MTGVQYEELCRYFVADKLQMPIEKVLSPQILNPLRLGPSGFGVAETYVHQIDLYWETQDGLAKYVNIANAKWRTSTKVHQADVLLLEQVRVKVGAHKAIMITNTGYTDVAVRVAKDEGIGLYIVKPTFDTAKMPEDRNPALAHIRQLTTPAYAESVVWKAAGESAAHALGAAGGRGGAGESSPGGPIIAPGVSAPSQWTLPVAPGSSGGARGGGGSGMSYRTGQGPGPGFVKK
jgi:hypothetical protein